jgi:hypothetical protein
VEVVEAQEAMVQMPPILQVQLGLVVLVYIILFLVQMLPMQAVAVEVGIFLRALQVQAV